MDLFFIDVFDALPMICKEYFELKNLMMLLTEFKIRSLFCFLNFLTNGQIHTHLSSI